MSGITPEKPTGGNTQGRQVDCGDSGEFHPWLGSCEGKRLPGWQTPSLRTYKACRCTRSLSSLLVFYPPVEGWWRAAKFLEEPSLLPNWWCYGGPPGSSFLWQKRRWSAGPMSMVKDAQSQFGTGNLCSDPGAFYRN